MEDKLIEKLYAEKSKLTGSCKAFINLSKEEIDLIVTSLDVMKDMKRMMDNYKGVVK